MEKVQWNKGGIFEFAVNTYFRKNNSYFTSNLTLLSLLIFNNYVHIFVHIN